MIRKYLTEWKRFLAEEDFPNDPDRFDSELIKQIAEYLRSIGGRQRDEHRGDPGEKFEDRIITINMPTKRRGRQMAVYGGSVTPTFMFDFNEETIYLTDGVHGRSNSSVGKPTANPSDNTPGGTRIDFYELGTLNDFKNWVRSTSLGQEKDDHGKPVINLP